MVSEEGLHAADDEIWCRKKDCMLQMTKYGFAGRITCCRLLNKAPEGLHAAYDEIWCQNKGYVLQIMKYGVRRRVTCCR